MSARCPQDGRFIGGVSARVVGLGEPEVIESVSAVCPVHGVVDVSEQEWAWEDFFPDA
jgi:hypothetical protein